MMNKIILIIALGLLSLGTQAQESPETEEKQETPKCPDDPATFKGKEDDCFDCLEGVLSKLKLFTAEAAKMLEDKKLSNAEVATSMKTRSEELWDGVEGWSKICQPEPETKPKSKDDKGAEPKADEAAEEGAEPKAEGDAEEGAEPKAAEGAETESESKSETATEEEAEPQAEAETQGEPEAEPNEEPAEEPGA